LSGSDPDGDTLTYSATGPPPGLVLDGSAGTIAGPLDVRASTGSPYVVTVTVSDGTASASTTFTWTVPHVNLAPGVAAVNNQTSVVGQAVSLPVTANDPNGDTLSYSATGLPTGLSINQTTGVISGTVASGADAGSPYTVTVSASDGPLQGSTTFTWAVSNPASSPVVRLVDANGQ